jgi:cytochrome P450
LSARVDDLVADHGFDVAATLATELPAIIVCRILGVPRADWPMLTKLTASAFDDSADPSTSVLEQQQASAEIFQYFYDLLDQRRFDPEDDIVSALSHPEREDERLSDDEILLNCDGLANGGLGTTRYAVSGAFHAFAANPDQWRLLKERPDLLDSAVDEVLRWCSPPMHVMRTASRDTQLGDAGILAGDRLVLWLPSCNRDETAFDDPDRFDITRRPNPHLSLGAGPHYCVGAPVARAELRCLLEILVERVRELSLDGDAMKLPSNFLNGYARLNVRVAGEHK